MAADVIIEQQYITATAPASRKDGLEPGKKI